MSAISHAIVAQDKNKLFQLVDGIPQFDMGPTITLPKSGIILDKISNGYSYRYRPRYGQVIQPASISNLTPDNTNAKMLMVYESN